MFQTEKCFSTTQVPQATNSITFWWLGKISFSLGNPGFPGLAPMETLCFFLDHSLVLELGAKVDGYRVD